MPDGASVAHAIGVIVVIVTILLKDRLNQSPPRLDMTLYERLGALEARIQTQETREIPPERFKAQVDRLEKRFDVLAEKIDNLHIQCRFHPPNPGMGPHEIHD